MSEPTLIGLLHELVMPGETRVVEPPVVSEGVCSALSATRGDGSEAEGPELVALCITSPAQLPSLITSRWATVCRLVAADERSLTLEGLRRVRVQTVSGREAPFTASVEELDDGERFGELVAEAHRLVAAIELGVPAASAWETLREAVYGVVRA